MIGTPINVGIHLFQKGLLGAKHSRGDGAAGLALDLGRLVVAVAVELCQGEG